MSSNHMSAAHIGPARMGPSLTPERSDTSIAMRTASLVVWAASVWFFVSPWAFYGLSERTSAWNCWIFGVLLIFFSSARLLRPLRSKAFSWINAILGTWVLISPLVFGYPSYSARLVNSMSVGAVILALSIASAKTTRGSGNTEM